MTTDNASGLLNSTGKSDLPPLDLSAIEGNKLSRDGDNLIVESASGAITVHANFFSDPDALVTFPGSSIEFSADMLVASFPFLQAAALVAGFDSSGAGEDGTATVVATIRETDGKARIIRNGNEIPVKPGDAILDGDIIDSSGSTAVKVEFVRALSRDASDEPATAVIGPNSRIQFDGKINTQSDAQELSVTLTMTSGAIAIDNLPGNGEGLAINTPSGTVIARGQDVGINVNGLNGETTVMALGDSASPWSTDSGIFIDRAGVETRMSIGGDGVVFQAGNSSFAPLGSASSTQLSPISSLLDAPGASSGGADPSGTPGSNMFSNTGPFSGTDSRAPFSGLSGGSPSGSSSSSSSPIQEIAPFSSVSPGGIYSGTGPTSPATGSTSLPGNVPALPGAPAGNSSGLITPQAQELPGLILTAISGISTADMSETNAVLVASGTLSTNKGAVGFVAQTLVPGSGGYGKFSITAAGEWSYIANSAHDEFKFGTVYTDTISVATSDGILQTITVNINGTNDVPVVSNLAGAALGSVTEAGNQDDGTSVAGTGSVTGTLSATDTDANATMAWSIVGTPAATYGSFALDAATGVWIYTLDNTLAATQALKEGESVTQAYTARVTDNLGASADQTVTVTINGTNDLPVVTNTAGARAGSVTESGNLDDGTVVAGTASATGTLSVSDVDADATRTWSIQGTPSTTYGSLALDAATGVWTYTLDNTLAATQALKEGESVTQTYTARMTDDFGAWVDQTVTITINGSNDVLSVSNGAGARAGSITEAGHLDDGTVAAGTASATGTLSAFDADADATGVWSIEGTPATTYGSFALNASTGVWTYTLDNTLAATQALKEGQSVTQAYTARVTDNLGAWVEQTVTVTINGTNDVPVVTNAAGALAGSVTESGHLDDGTVVAGTASATGTLSVSDVDADATRTWSIQGTPSTTYGSLALDASTGVWIYTLDNTLAATQALKEGQLVTQTYTARATDDFGAWVNQTITISINGTNDLPVATADTGSTAENATLTVAAGSGLLDNDTDVDADATHTVSAVNGLAGNVAIAVAGTTGGSFTIAADGAYTFNPGSAFDYLAAGESQVTSVTYTNRDNNGAVSSNTLSVTVTGSNDTPVAMAATTSATEDGSLVTGTLTSTDLDVTGRTATYTLDAPVAGLTLATNGSYSFDPANAAYQSLALGATTSVVANYTVTDDKGATGTSTLTITVTGVNDLAVIGGVSSASLTETDAALTAGGTLTVSDVDGTQTFVAQTLAAGSNGYGKFSIDSAGVWTYAANNAHNEFSDGVAYTDSITVATTDGVLKVITVTITGTTDVYAGGSGGDTLTGGPDADTLSGGAGGDTYIITDPRNVVVESAGEGIDEVRTTLTAYTLTANVENLVFTGTGNAAGTGNELANTITGNVGNDTLDGGIGADTLIGGAGNDVYVVDNAGDIVTEALNAGTDEVRTTLTAYTLTANVENLVFTGTGNAAGTGNGLANTITGNVGNDTLDGGAGADTLIGGAGDDVYIVDNAGDVVTEAANEGTDTVRTSLASHTLAANVENLVFTGSTNATGTGNALANTITGGTGNDTLDGGAGIDTLSGGDGNDTLVYDANDSLIDGGAGTDTLRFLANANLATDNVTLSNIEVLDMRAVNGGTATQIELSAADVRALLASGTTTLTINGDSGDRILVSDQWVRGSTAGGYTSFTRVHNAETLTLNLSTGVDLVANLGGSSSDDNLVGDSTADTLAGGAGNDTLNGGGGIDTMTGGTGNDVYAVDVSGDVVNENASEGTDEIRTVLTSYSLAGLPNIENLTYTDVTYIAPGAGAFTGTGNALDNVITGGNGADTLTGGLGNDTLVGLDGNDTFIGDAGNDSISGGNGTDTIDYSAETGGVTVTLATTGGSASGAIIGTDQISGIENITGGAGNDNITGSDDLNLLAGGLGNDTLDGGAGDDTLIGGAGNDSYIGGLGTDTADFSGETSSISINLGTGIGTDGSGGSDTFTGVENVTGGSAGDTLTGDAIANRLDGGAGADTLTGGAGDDVYIVDNAGDVVTEAANEGTETVRTSLASHTLAANVENLVFTSSANSSGTGNALANTITGGIGNDTLDGGAGIDTLTGGDGNDTLVYDANDGLIDGGAGTDTLRFLANANLATDNVTLSNIEVLDMRAVNGGTATQIELSAADVRALLASGTTTLTINGDSGDRIVVSDQWVRGSTAGGYTSFTRVHNAETLTLRLATGVDLVANLGGSSGGDNLIGDSTGDTLSGGAGNDTLNGGGGIDTMTGGTGNDVYTVDVAGDVVNEEASEGTDEIRTVLTSYSLAGLPNIENLTYSDVTYIAPGAGAFTGTGNDLDNVITGGNGADTLTGGIGNDTLVGLDGNDTFIGDAGNDSISGGNGTDTIDYSAETGGVTVTLATTVGSASGAIIGTDQISGIENITGGAGNDNITGSDDFNLLDGGLGNDTLAGGAGNDTLLGGGGNDTLDGGFGNDTLIGGTGNDSYIGGVGIDTADFSGESSGISVNLGAGTGTDGNGGSDTFTGVENVTGGSGNDILTGDANANRLDGGAGNDTIAGAAGNDTLIGGLGIDTLDYSAISAAVTVNMSAAAVGLVAANTASDGQGGTDSLSGFEYVLGGSGNDTLVGGAEVNLLVGNAGNDLLSGGAGNDTLQGGVGDDSLRGGAGDDSLDGGSNLSGGDTADYSDQATAVIVNLGTVSATGTTIGVDSLSNIENIAGGSGADTLTGDASANQIWGNAGNDTILGGDGNDSLRGGQGNDSIDGGIGIDTVVFDDVNGPITVNLAAGSAVGTNSGTDILLNIENIVGSGGSDTLTGSAGDNVIDGADGGDSINGGDGNDTILYDENDAFVDGGAGTGDVLLVRAGLTTLDLTLVRDEVFTNFEILDVTVAGTQFVKISDTDIKALTGGGATGTLIIRGGSEDSVRLVGANWPTTSIPVEVIDGANYNVYTYNGATVKIKEGVSVGYLFSSGELGELTTASSGGDVYEGNGGNDTLYAGGGDDYGNAGSGDDLMTGDAGNDTLLGGTGNDTIYGGDAIDSAASGNDSIDGGDGNDSISAADGDDTVSGGAGNDTISAGSGSDSVTGGEGNDSILAGSGNDTVDAGGGNDLINEGEGEDSINAGTGDDTVIGGAGNDTLDGSSGVDTIDYSAESAAVTINLSTGSGTGTGIGTDTLLNFENVIGGAGNDVITGNDAANRITGGSGSDSIATGGGNDWILFDANDVLVDAGIGVDTLAIADTTVFDFTAIDDSRYIGIEEIDLTGNGVQDIRLNAADVVAFSDSTDTLKIHGDAGDKLTLAGNWVNAGTQPVSYNGAANQSYVKLTLVIDATTTATVLVDPALTLDIVYQGAATSDTLSGGAGADSVDGGAGNDSLDGAAGADSVYGGIGNDTIIYDSNDIYQDGGADTDTLKFAATASGVVLDFGDLARPAADGLRPTLTGFEIIDITGAGNNSVVIDSTALKALSDSTDSLDINGNTGDTVYIVGSWTTTGTPVGGYNIYTKDGATLRVATAIAVGAVVDDPNGDLSSANPIPGATSGADVIRGLGGDDTLNGALGADVLRGGAGNDVLIYDASDLIVDGGDDTDTLQLSASLNLAGVAGNKITNIEIINLVAGSGSVTLSATAADIVALNTAATVRVNGDASDSVALSGNWVTGATTSGFTAYTLDGATLNIAQAIVVTVTYSGTSQGNIMIAGAGNQTLDALAGNDSLDGGSGSDILLAGSGDDVLVHDAADSLISGGAGTDTLQISGAGVTIDLTAIANSIITGIEKIDLTGSGDNTLVTSADDVQALSTDTDTLIVTGNVGDSVRLSGSGWEARGSELVAGITYNKFIGYATDGSLVTVLGGLKMVKGDQIVGAGGNDTLVGGTGSDDIQGMAGNDSIDGGTGSDLLDGGADDDTIVYDALDTTLGGGLGNDTLQLNTSGEIIDLQEAGRPATGALRPALSSFEVIDLNTSGANVLILDEASLSGLAGSTLTVSGNASDIVFVDGVLSSTLNLTGGVTQTALTRGTSGADTITGTSGQDAIKTDAGNDTVDGGLGADIIYTGIGDDRVSYDAADLRVFGGTGTDTLVISAVDSDGGINATVAGTNSVAGDIDLTLVAGSIVSGFEVIEMRGNGNQTVKLDSGSVQTLSDTDHITVMGDLGDVLKLYGAWVYSNVESDSDGKLYTVMNKGDAYVHVVSEVTLDITNELGGKVVIGTSGADDRTVATNGGVITGDGDDLIRINNMSFTGVDGGRGYDKVYFQFTGDINTALLSPTSLTNIEEIDLASGSTGANKLILTPEKLLQMTDSDRILVVKGNIANDSIDLYGQWSPIETAADVLYNGVTYKALTASNGAQLYYTPGLAVAKVDPTQQMTAFSVAYDDGAYLVSAGIDKYAGWKVADAGDVNKDGITDIIVNQAGSAYVVFGTESMQGQIDLNNLGSRGFMINAVGNGLGGHTFAHYPEWQSLNYGLTPIGDVNGDGIADMVSSTNEYNTFRVVYGRTEWSDIDLTSSATFASGSSNGFTVTTSFNWSGGVLGGLAGVGDVNGDGYDDYVINNMWSSDINNQGDSGKSYLMFGGAYSGNITTSSMSTTRGVVLSSDSSNYIKLGTDITALGDINADGFADFAMGGPGLNNAGTNGQQERSGSGYIVFGKAEGWGNSVVVQRDNTGPTLRGGNGTPVDGQTGYPLAYPTEFQQAFSESVTFGTGYISLYNQATGVLVEKFDVTTGLGSLGGKMGLRGWHVANDLLQLNTFNPLAPNTGYYFTIDATAIRDLAGNYFAGIADSTTWNFSTTSAALNDVTAPTLGANVTLYHSVPEGTAGVNISTSGGSTGIAPVPTNTAGNPIYRLDFSFNENMKPYGTVTVSQNGSVVEVFDLQTGLGSRGGSVQFHSGTVVQDSNSYGLNFGATLSGNTLTTVTLSGFQDVAGNRLNGGIAQNFSYTTSADTTGPVLTNGWRLHSPSDGQGGVSVENNIVFQADETLLPGASGSIQLRLSSSYNGTAVETFAWSSALVASNGVYTLAGNHGGVLTINNRTVTLNPGANLAYNTGYDLYVSAGALTDPSGNAATGYTAVGGYNFTTTTGLLAVAGGNAVDHSLKVAVGDNLVISFNESVTAGTASLGSQFVKLWNSSGTLIESFDVADSDGSNGSKGGNLSFTGYNVVINPAQNLALASGYYLTVDSQAIKSLNAASTTYYAGVSNTTTLSFSSEAAVQIDPGQLNSDFLGQWAGQQIEGVGDVDGDGINDFVVGSYQQVNDATIPGGYAYGKYYLVFGQAGQWAPIQNIQQLKDAGRVVEIYGTAGNWLTRVVEFGDLNKDGFNDLLLTSGGWYPDNDGSPVDRLASNDGDIDAGAAFVVYGQARSNWTTSVNITQLGTGGLEITGGLPQEQFGFSAATGDFNNDGTIDIVFGMPVNHRDGYASGEGFVLNGGDFTDSLMNVGTAGADTILGDFNANRIAGQQGNDIIYGLGGADILRGGADNDTIGISDLNFVLVDGGTGTDTLKFVGHGINLDMTGYAGASVRSFETIDLTGDGNNSLVINYSEVSYLLERQLSQAYGNNVKLTINGDAGDAVTLEGPWAVVGTDATHTTYALEGLYIRIDSDVTRTVQGWTIPYNGATMDLFAMPSGFRTSTVTSGMGLDSAQGNFLINIGDINNDGFNDFAVRQDVVTSTALRWYERREHLQGENVNGVGVWGWYPQLNARSDTVTSGEAYIVYGKAGGLGTVNLAAPVGGNAIKLTGSASANENLGVYMNGLGDINGDGVSDMVIGASQSSKTFTFNEGGEKSAGDPTGTDLAHATDRYQTVPGIGSQSPDWNNDSWAVSNEGRQYFFLGNNEALVNKTGGAISTTTLANDYNSSTALPTTYDTAIEAITDLPDRGPANNVANTVYTYSTTATAADGSFIGAAGAQYGSNWQPVSLGDVNGDGFDDFVTGTSSSRLILGSASGWTGLDVLSSTVTWTQKLVTISGNQNNNGIVAAGDVNGDGYADFLLNWDGNGAHLIFGKAGNNWNATTTLNATTAATGTTTASTFIAIEAGQGINPTYTRGLGDINGDGYDDILFAAQSANDYNAKDNGGAYVLFGSATGWGSNVSLAGLAAAGRGFRVTGAVDFDYAGYDATNAGDVNGDGYNDFLIAAYGDDESANGTGAAGSAYLIFGRSTGWRDISLLQVQDFGIQIFGGAANSGFVWQQLGDVDGDGLDDLSYSNSNATTTTILYGNENFTSGSNIGVQHITDINDATPGNSIINGGILNATRGIALADTLIGNAGHDILTGDGGRDVLIGGAGNDLMKVADANFFKLDGGTGIDTVELTAGMTIDFTALANTRVEGIEVLKLGAGDQVLTLNAFDVLNMTGDLNTAVNDVNYQKGHVLVIDSEGGNDDVTLNTGWNSTAVATGVSVSGSTGTFSVYQHGTDNIYAVIDDAITRHIG